MALLVRTVAAACAVLTLFVCTVGASSAATTASLQLVNEGFPIPHGLTVTSTVAPPAAAVTDADTTLFAAVQRNSFTSYTSVATAAQTLSLVNVTTGAVVGAVAVAAGDFAAGEEYTLFVGPDGAQEGALTGRIMPSLPKSSDWPAQHVDVALFRVLSADLTHAVVAVNTTSSNCWECLAVFREAASPMPMIANFMTASVPHDYVLSLSVVDAEHQMTELHRETYAWREEGVYTVVIPAAGSGGAARAYVLTHKEGNNVAIPLLVWAAALLGLTLLYNLGRYIVYRVKARSAAPGSDHRNAPRSPGGIEAADSMGVYAGSGLAPGAGPHSPSGGLDVPDDLARHATYSTSEAGASIKPGKSGRVVAVDTFRGLALCIMIFVNYGGGGYWFFNHSWWNGLTVADLVFPWFVWIMGTSMAISHNSAKRKGLSRGGVMLKVVVRSAKLFAIGLFLNNGYVLSQWRILGVLQYFAISSLVVATIAQFVPMIPCGQRPKKAPGGTGESLFNDGYGAVVGTESAEFQIVAKNQFRFADCLPYLLQWCCILSLLALYLCIQFLLDVPGCGRGYIGPGGNGNFGKHRGCAGGAHGYIDKLIFGEKHMYHNNGPDGEPVSAATCAGATRYDCDVYDPEGTLGYLTASLMCFLGLQAGRILVEYKGHKDRLVRWVCWGLVECAIGTALCGASQNDGVIPLAKNLWSPSFILVMAGTGNLVLSVCYVLVDLWHFWGGGPFKFVGMNSIVVYAFSEILQMYFPFTIMVDMPVAGERGLGFRSHSSALVGNTIGVATWLLVAYFMARNKIFINV